MSAIGKLFIFNPKESAEVISEWIWEHDEIVYEDKWGRRWKLVPNTNENIVMPFIIQPVPKE